MGYAKDEALQQLYTLIQPLHMFALVNIGKWPNADADAQVVINT